MTLAAKVAICSDKQKFFKKKRTIATFVCIP